MCRPVIHKARKDDVGLAHGAALRESSTEDDANNSIVKVMTYR